jgi:hypothetical protein
MAATACPKCDYVRLATDIAPEWQCPKCGVAYNKADAVAKAEAAAAARAAAAAANPKPRAGDRSHGRGMVSPSKVGDVDAGLVYGALLFAGLFLDARTAWMFVCAGQAASALFFWARSYRVKRAILDVPTSKVRSAAQGYVELSGTIEPLAGRTVKGRLTLEPCVWYYFMVVEGSGKNSRVIERGELGIPFLLRDSTGTCLVVPGEARIISDALADWKLDNRHYCEWSMRAGDPVYVIGEFHSDALGTGEDKVRIAARVREWALDPRSFVRRFDSNRDGKVSPEELEGAREAARREAVAEYAAQGGSHRMASPRDGRPYVLANWPHDQVARHFGILTNAHLFVVFVALAFLAYHLSA